MHGYTPTGTLTVKNADSASGKMRDMVAMMESGTGAPTSSLTRKLIGRAFFFFLSFLPLFHQLCPFNFSNKIIKFITTFHLPVRYAHALCVQKAHIWANSRSPCHSVHKLSLKSSHDLYGSLSDARVPATVPHCQLLTWNSEAPISGRGLLQKTAYIPTEPTSNMEGPLFFIRAN